ncbi:hypothetical protein D4A39_16655 [Alcanivorax profundi]|uniref:Uncharacterized protein n=1 Tax=Alcanivorax profundi TaxID=2338368 RepID=A0A418XS18_9GAMM|nr:hypothetical protein [Alcanivorax profundi]RJG15347.1 hypothetical protein D4A39_16655 [Alcanivorax profundi]
MPIRIDEYQPGSEEAKRQNIAWLCDDDFELPNQLAELRKWVLSTAVDLEPGEYSVDIAFSPREGAAGGGESIPVEVLRVMAEKGMELYFSEYPPFVEADET